MAIVRRWRWSAGRPPAQDLTVRRRPGAAVRGVAGRGRRSACPALWLEDRIDGLVIDALMRGAQDLAGRSVARTSDAAARAVRGVRAGEDGRAARNPRSRSDAELAEERETRRAQFLDRADIGRADGLYSGLHRYDQETTHGANYAYPRENPGPATRHRERRRHLPNDD